MKQSVWSLVLALGCASAPAKPSVPEAAAPAPAAKPASEPIALTYLGVAGWQIEAGGTTVLVDPYVSRPNLDALVASDPAAVAKHAPKRAAAILVGHSHVDHLLDAPAMALATGAQVIGSETTALIARASGVPDAQIIPVQGGEDYAFPGFSVRVMRSLHSALDHKQWAQGKVLTAPVQLPMRWNDYPDGGTFIYLLRIAGKQVLIASTANFIESELVGLRPDIAIIAPGLREEIYDYSCRLMRVLGNPPVVYATHFDSWTKPPAPVPAAETQDFVDEIRACSPNTRVVIPTHFQRVTEP